MELYIVYFVFCIIYYLSHNFIYSGDINFTYQTRDKVQNINQGSHDVSFGIINPLLSTFE